MDITYSRVCGENIYTAPLPHPTTRYKSPIAKQFVFS
jgi:hypothetical protein